MHNSKNTLARNQQVPWVIRNQNDAAEGEDGNRLRAGRRCQATTAPGALHHRGKSLYALLLPIYWDPAITLNVQHDVAAVHAPS